MSGEAPKIDISVQHGYDRWAAVYDHDVNPLVALEEPAVHAALPNLRGCSALDLGCGTGRHALWLATQGAHVTAIDFSGGMLAEARKKPGADAVRFLVHDLHEPLPTELTGFDVLVSGLVLEHIRELDPFFRLLKSAIRSGGRVVVTGMHPAMSLRGVQARFTDPATGEVVRVESRPHSIGAFVMAAIRAGFRLESVGEHSPDAEFAERIPRAEKYVGWPMLVVMCMVG